MIVFLKDKYYLFMNNEGTIKELFRQKCYSVAASFLLDIKNVTAIKGAKPSFEDLMKVLQILDTQLTTEGVKLLENYKAEAGSLPDELTTDFKNTIAETVETFVKQL